MNVYQSRTLYYGDLQKANNLPSSKEKRRRILKNIAEILPDYATFALNN